MARFCIAMRGRVADLSARTSPNLRHALSAPEYVTAAGEMEKTLMSKRLIYLALCVLMLLSVCLTSCKKEETELDTSASAMTLTMLAVTENQVYYTDEEYAALSAEEKARVDEIKAQYDAVEAAINKITKAKYRTQLEIYYYTQEQYDEIVEEKLESNKIIAAERDSATKEYKRFQRTEKRNGNEDPVLVYEKFVEQYPQYAKYITAPTGTKDEETETEAVEEGNGLDVAYPIVDPDQVDILFIGSYEQYTSYIEEGWLSSLDASLKSGVAKKLTTYVYPAFLAAAKTEKGYYAIPNNTIVGEYTTLLVNKTMCDKYSDISKLNCLYDVLPLIKDVAKYETGIDPVWAKSSREFTNVHFWSFASEANEKGEYVLNPDNFSVIGATYKADYTSTSTSPKYYAPGNLLSDTAFRNQLIALKTLEFEGYYGAEDSQNDFAVAVVKGSAKEIEAYKEKYYTISLENPVATQADLFGSMFAVSAFTSDVNRSMEIITLLNTDAAFRNLFQYGIQEVNYNLNEEDCAERTSDNLYMMDIYKTGNMFIAYPDADEGMNQQTLEYAKQQDREVVTNPTLGFTIVEEDTPNADNIAKVNNVSDILLNGGKIGTTQIIGINNCKTVDELQKDIDNVTKYIDGSAEGMKIFVQTALNPILTGDGNFSISALYFLWAQNMGYASAS